MSINEPNHDNAESSSDISIPIYNSTRHEILQATMLELNSKARRGLYSIEKRMKSVVPNASLNLYERDTSPNAQFADECYRILKEFFFEGHESKPLPKEIQFDTSRGPFLLYRTSLGSEVQRYLRLDRGHPLDVHPEVLRLLIPKEKLPLGSITIFAHPNLQAKDPNVIEELKELLHNHEGFLNQYDSMSLDNINPYHSRQLCTIVSFFTSVANYHLNKEIVNQVSRAINSLLTNLPDNWGKPLGYELCITQNFGGNAIYQNDLTWFSGGSSKLILQPSNVLKIKDNYIDISPNASLGMFNQHNTSAFVQALGSYYLEALKFMQIYYIVPGSGNRMPVNETPRGSTSLDLNPSFG